VILFIDVHIHFPLYDFLAFKTLGNSYLELKDHKLFSLVEDIFQSRASSTEISELMCESELNEPGYKIDHHSVANRR